MQLKEIGRLGVLGLALLVGQAAAQECEPTSEPAVGKRTLDSPLNVFTYTSQRTPSIGILPDGRMVVAWASRRQEASTYGVFARLTDAHGRPLGDEVHVNAFMPRTQWEPAVGVGGDGTVWIAWSSLGQDGDQMGVIARRFRVEDGRLVPLGGEIAVNRTRAGSQSMPSVAALDDGRAMIVWSEAGADGQRVLGRVFDARGNAMSDEFVLGSPSQPARFATVTRCADGFLAAFAGVDDDGAPSGLWCRAYGADGTPRADPVEIARVDEAVIEPSLDANASGDAAIAWLRARAGGGYDIFCRRLHGDGTPAGEAHLVASGADGWKSGASVAMHDDGRFVVSYTTDTGEDLPLELRPSVPSDVMAVVFDRDGRAMGPARRVHAIRDGHQGIEASPARRSVWGSREHPAFCWEGETGRDGSGVALSTLVPEDVEIAASGGGEAQAFGYEEVAASASIPPIFDEDWVPPPPDDDVRPNTDDFGFQSWNGTGWVPPDPDLSVGPNTIVGVVNVAIRIFDKQGTQLFNQDLVPFFSSVGANGFLFDPVAVFDRHSNRHIVCVIEHTGGNQTSWINIAVSKTPDPQNGDDWWKYRFNTTTPTGGSRFIDYENLGVDEEAIYVAADYFAGTGGNWVHIFDKAPMLGGQPTTMQVLRTSGSFRSLGAVNHIDSDAPGGYFATSFGNGSTEITIDAITDPLTNPVRHSVVVGVPGYSQPPGAAQQGSSNRISTVDQRIKNGVYRNGSLWLTHNIGIDGVARVRYYEIAMNGWPTSGQSPTLVQSGEVDLGPGIYTFFGDPGVDADNNFVLQFNRSSSDEFVSIQRIFRLSGDSPGTLRDAHVVQTSNSPDNSGRWGDYTGMEEDPAEPRVFWGHDEYSINGGWRTWVGQIDLNSAIPDIEFVFPNGIPEFVDPSGETIRVEVVGTANGDPQPGTGMLHFDLSGSGVFAQIPMDEVSPNVYDAVLPPVACLSNIDFYFSAESTTGERFSDPAQAPGQFYSATAVVANVVALDDDFETDQGWIVENLGASAGDWERGIPINDPGWVHDPASDGDGSGQCYLTQNTPGNSDVDNGSVRLTSPLLDMSAEGDFSISYLYYLRLSRSSAEDGLLVEVSDNDLVGPWRTIVDHTSDGGTVWRSNTITESDLTSAGLNITDRMRIRFTARDNDPQSIVEAGIDGVLVSALTCSEPGCPADLDGNGTLDANDFFTFLDLFAAGDPAADITGNGVIDANDFFAYLDLFAAGC